MCTTPLFPELGQGMLLFQQAIQPKAGTIDNSSNTQCPGADNLMVICGRGTYSIILRPDFLHPPEKWVWSTQLPMPFLFKVCQNDYSFHNAVDLMSQ